MVKREWALCWILCWMNSRDACSWQAARRWKISRKLLWHESMPMVCWNGCRILCFRCAFDSSWGVFYIQTKYILISFIMTTWCVKFSQRHHLHSYNFSSLLRMSSFMRIMRNCHWNIESRLDVRRLSSREWRERYGRPTRILVQHSRSKLLMFSRFRLRTILEGAVTW